MSASEDEQDRLRNNRRRQAYYRRRRTIQRLEREPNRVHTESMKVAELAALLEWNLHHLLMELSNGASVDHYQMARTAWECYAEIISRGETIRLLD